MAMEVKVPSPGESVTEVIIDSWLKADGDFVERDEPIAEIQSDKAMLTLYAESSGALSIKVEAGEEVEVGVVIATIDESATGGAPKSEATKEATKPEEKPAAQPQTAPAAQPAASQSSSYASGTPSPAAEKNLSERGISPSDVKGTGPGGRVTKADALAHQPSNGSTTSAPSATPAPQATPQVANAASFSREVRREKMSSLRRTLANRLVSVKNETAMLTTFQEVDMSAILNLRKQYKEGFEKKHGIRLGFMGFFVLRQRLDGIPGRERPDFR